MAEGGYIKLHRSMLDWEWYGNINVKILFLHCLLKANWKPGRFQGVDIPKGAFATSYTSLASETGLSERQIRTALSNLRATGELTLKRHPKFSVITIKNYSLYQSADTQTDTRATTIEEGKNIKKLRNHKSLLTENIPDIESVGESSTPPPTPKSKKVTIETLEEALASRNYSDNLKQTLSTWLRYREEIKKPFKTMIGFEKLLTQISSAVDEHGETKVIDLINEGMGQGWQGIIFERLNKQEGASNDRGQPKADRAGASGDRAEPPCGSLEYYRGLGWKG